MARTIAAALIVLVVFLLPPASEAVSIGASGTYGPPGSVGGCVLGFCTDLAGAFTLTNVSDLLLGVEITEVVIALGTGLTFNGLSALAPNPGFTAVGASSALTGFTGAIVGATSLTLGFTDFNPLEVFAFAIDVDDSVRTVTGSEFAGSTLTVSFLGGDTLAGAYTAALAGTTAVATVRGVVDRQVPVPEPSTIVLVASGLLAMGLGAGRRWSRRLGVA
jgi:hypothetical protein